MRSINSCVYLLGRPRLISGCGFGFGFGFGLAALAAAGFGFWSFFVGMYTLYHRHSGPPSVR